MDGPGGEEPASMTTELFGSVTERAELDAHPPKFKQHHAASTIVSGIGTVQRSQRG